jgi:hypothetical protein
MINLFKCPICNQSARVLFYEHQQRCVTCCGVTTPEKFWNKYAVSVAYTKLNVEFETCKPEEEHIYQEMIGWALKDAIKEFKNEKVDN